MNCIHCSYTTDDQKAFIKHSISGHYRENTEILCPYCKEIFFTKSAFRSHIQRNHKNKVNLIERKPASETNLRCQFCKEKICSSKIQAHIRQHFKQIPLFVTICPICPAVKIKTITALNVHFFRLHKVIHNYSSDSENLFIPLADASLSTPPAFFQSEFSPTFSQANSSPADTFDFSKRIAFVLLKLKAKHALTDVVIDTLVGELDSIMESVLDEVFAAKDEFDIDFVKEKFSLSKKMGTKFKRDKYFRLNTNYVAPQKYILGRNNNHRTCFAYYVPILKNLESIFKDEAFSALLDQKTLPVQGILQDFEDGLAFQNNEFFQNTDYKKIVLFLYSDAFQLCTHFGKKQKVNGIYYSIGNLAPQKRNKVDNIQLAMLFKDKDAKQFLPKIYSIILRDLKVLQDKGVNIVIENRKGTILAEIADNLEAHRIGGYPENFSTSQFLCRYCDITKFNIADKDLEVKMLRSPDNYAIDELGVKAISPLNSLTSYHVAAPGLPPCIGHDLFHGAFKYDLLLILNNLTKIQKLFTFAELNVEILKVAKNIKISLPEVTDASINCNMHGVWMLIVSLPLVFLNFSIRSNLLVLKFFQAMLNITRYVTANSISTDQVMLLRTEIHDYMNLKLKLFPNSKFLPKLHYMNHYPDLILQFGPLKHMWTLNFEHKHQMFIYASNRAKNFINPLKMLSERHQLLQATIYGDRVSRWLICNKVLPMIPHTFVFQFGSNFEFVSKKVTCNGKVLKAGDHVIIEVDFYDVQVLEVSDFIISTDYNSCFAVGSRKRFNYNFTSSVHEFFKDSTTCDAVHDLKNLVYHKSLNVLDCQDKLCFSLHSTLPFKFND